MLEGTTRGIGVDIGDKYCVITVKEADGEVAERTRIPTTKTGVKKYFSRQEPARVAMEVGTHSRWISEIVSGLGFEVFVANPRKLQVISKSDNKCDTFDSEILAECARTKSMLLFPIQHRGEQAQAALAPVRARGVLVTARTKLINHVRGVVKACGERLPKGSSESFHKLLEELPEARRQALEPLMRVLATLTEEIDGYERQIKEIADKQFPEVAILQQVPGVGPLTSLTFVATVETPNRFPETRKVGSFVGLRPRRDQSGAVDRQLPITKAGDSYLRQLLVSSAHYILGPFGPDTDLRRWGLKLATRGGKNAKKRAVVAVARKLAVLLLTLWKSGAKYEPLRQAERATAGQEAAAAGSTASEGRAAA